MVEIFPKVTVAGLSPISTAYAFNPIYGFGRYGEPDDEVSSATLSIPSSDMNLISPPGNAPLKLVYIRRRYVLYAGDVEFNDWIDYVVSGENIAAIENHPSDANNDLLVTVRPNNYIYYTVARGIRSLAFYKFITNKVDYAKFGVWSTDDWRMTDGNPFSYREFSTNLTSYEDLLTIDLLKPISLDKMGFWLGLRVSSSSTGYLRCLISEDGTTWSTLFETNTTSTSEVSVKVLAQNIRTRYINLQCFNSVGGETKTTLRVRELHFWGDYQW